MKANAIVVRRQRLICRTLVSAICIVVALSVSNAQQSTGRGTAVSEEAALLAPGWAALAAGDAASAGATAARVLGQFPTSAAALVLLVDADIARAGAETGLGAYESWLGARRLEDAYVLRRIARAMLREASLGKDAAARVQSLRALAADGDAEAIGRLNDAAAQGRLTETLELAKLGQDRAVRELIKQLNSPLTNRGAVIGALAQSRSPLAVAPLVKLLSDPNEDTQALAADALGRLGAREAAASLRPLLADEKKPFHVRFAAAGALHRLGDPTGTIHLRNLLDGGVTPHARVRIQAAEGLAAVPGDASYLPAVRSLASDADPVVRIIAARILAPYDQPLAKSLLEAAALDQNPSVREMASQALAGQVAGDFATLRKLLRSSDTAARLAAATRILELTR
jgi:HEAT repeat protein